MAMLSFHPGHKAFVWTGTFQEAKDAAGDLSGWTQTTVAPAGMVRYYTADYHTRPMFNPWAALHFWTVADDEARAVLKPFKEQYDLSFALDAPPLDIPLPPGRALFPFQVAGVSYSLARPHSLIGDPMGLGKTVQALAMVNITMARRVLVICPAAVLWQWRDMIRDWTVPLRPGRPDGVFVIATKRHGVHPTARFVLVSYDRMRTEIGRALARERWDMTILDEAHYLRNHSAQRTRAVLGAWDERQKATWPGVVDSSARVVALTGTPLVARPRECYTLGRALDWEALGWMSEEAFQSRFNPSMTEWWEDKSGLMRPRLIERVGRLPELQARLRCGFMVRREKEAAAPQLPAKLYSVIELGNAETDRIVRAERLLDIDPSSLEDIPIELRGHVAALRKEMGIAMVPLVVDYVKLLAEGAEDEPVVLYAYHLEVIAQLAEKLKSLRPVVVTGSTSPVLRQKATKTFAADPNCRLFIGQLQAAGTGIDGLQTRGRRIVFAEPSWLPSENEQCVDRLHRVGQTRTVQIDFLVPRDSMNARIISRAVERLRVIHVALDSRAA
jgi:SWI/SNF-related matrix-associated actin-dependent regulator 1 of chromatin subfamily A